MKKITAYIPNSITSMNLLCGILGVIFAFSGRLDVAFLLMISAAIFDFCDGAAARLLHAYSDMGKELDSLADVVSFGVLPSVMLVNLMKDCTFSHGISMPVWCYVPVIIAVFSGLRLAKFNVDPRQHESFIGLPTPACALICGALANYIAVSPSSFLSVWACGYVFIPVVSVVLSLLLVCEVPMFSMKFKKDDLPVVKRKRICFAVNSVIAVGIVLLLGIHWTMAVVLAFVVYILMNLAFAAFKI